MAQREPGVSSGEAITQFARQEFPAEPIENKSAEALAEVLEDFAERVLEAATNYALHRGASQVEDVDIALALRKHWGISVRPDGKQCLKGVLARSHRARLEQHASPTSSNGTG
ncbi:MAG: hypothetical protein MHM6MM_007706 [Cercozoa sp. M6MM]